MFFVGCVGVMSNAINRLYAPTGCFKKSVFRSVLFLHKWTSSSSVLLDLFLLFLYIAILLDQDT